MSDLDFVKSVVVDVDGTRRIAIRAFCECGCEKFRIFQVEGHTHFHLECARCHTSFCPAGADDKHEEASRGKE